jgi:hypothetical protein
VNGQIRFVRHLLEQRAEKCPHAARGNARAALEGCFFSTLLGANSTRAGERVARSRMPGDRTQPGR